MVQDFLYPRWDQFVYALNYSLINNVTFNQPLELGIIFLLYEEPFVYSRQVYPTKTSGKLFDFQTKTRGKIMNVCR